MPLREQVKGIWKDKVVGCFGDSPKDDDQPALQVSDPVSSGPTGPTPIVYQRYRHSQKPKPAPPPQDPTRTADEDPQDVQKIGDAWILEGVGSFLHKAKYTFADGTLPDGLDKSDYLVQDTERNGQPGVPYIPYNHRFAPNNVQFGGGFLQLKVPGGQRPSRSANKAVSCAEIATSEQNILYASVRTRAMFSRVPGTCHGIFFYANDTQETDIEFLTDPSSLSNNGPNEPIPIWYSNQAVDPVDAGATQETGPAPFDCTSRVHEYRMDWTADFTAFYIDGVQQKLFTDNIPSVPGPWVWNNWANGDRGWSAGPPKQDNIFKIQSILMYYNTSEPTDGN